MVFKVTQGIQKFYMGQFTLTKLAFWSPVKREISDQQVLLVVLGFLTFFILSFFLFFFLNQNGDKKTA